MQIRLSIISLKMNFSPVYGYMYKLVHQNTKPLPLQTKHLQEVYDWGGGGRGGGGGGEGKGERGRRKGRGRRREGGRGGLGYSL